MASKRSRRIDAIRAWSRRMRRLLGVVLLILPVAVGLAFLAGLTWGGDFHYGGSVPVDLSLLSAGDRMGVVALTLLTLASHLAPLLFLRRLFTAWADGDLLSRSAALALRHTGLALLAAGTVSALIGAMEAGFLHLPGAGPSFDLGTLLAGGVVYLVGMVMDEAARVAEEAEMTV